MTSALLLEHITKTYPRSMSRKKVTAVADLNFDVRQGEVFGFIGPNGAGKSTTIKILTGALRVSGGRAEIFGVPVGDPDSRRGVGFVPEHPSLYDYLTPLEILEMGMTLHRVVVDRPREHCLKWLERFGLGAVAKSRIKGFSKGMLQRTALVHALAVQPRLLILDEPLSGLDPIGRRDVVEVLAEYKADGGTIFMTSHVLHDIERLADRFGLIHQGRLRAVQSPSDLGGQEEVVVVRTFGAKGVDGMVSDGSGRWSCELTRSGLWSRLELLRAAGHEIIEIKPALNLETAFLLYVSGSALTLGAGQEGGSHG